MAEHAGQARQYYVTLEELTANDGHKKIENYGKNNTIHYVFDNDHFKEGKFAMFSDYTDDTRTTRSLFVMCKVLNGGPCAKCNVVQKRRQYHGAIRYVDSTWRYFYLNHKTELNQPLTPLVAPPAPGPSSSNQPTRQHEHTRQHQHQHQHRYRYQHHQTKKRRMDSSPDESSADSSEGVAADASDDEDEDGDVDVDAEEEDENTSSVYIRAKKLVKDLVNLKISGLSRRLEAIEQQLGAVKTRKIRINPKRSNGCCRGCGLEKTGQPGQDGKRIKPSKVKLDLMKSPVLDPNKSTSVDTVNPREIDAKKFNKGVLNHHRYCADCIKLNDNPYIFDTANRNVMCMICRTRRATNAKLYCAFCRVDDFQTGHATFKKPLHYAFKLLEHTVMEIEKVETSTDWDSNDIFKGEYNVGDLGSIDYLLKITTTDKKVHMFAIEVMATKVETLHTHVHKYREAMARIKPDKTYVVAFDIANCGGGLKLEEKIDVFRRWVIFAIRYANKLPNMNNWWLFPTRNAYACPENTELFYKQPVRISQAPKGIKSNWEFASDAFAGHVGQITKRTVKPDVFAYALNSANLVDPSEFMFAGNMEHGHYALFNVDIHGGLKCPIVDCAICAPTAAAVATTIITQPQPQAR